MLFVGQAAGNHNRWLDWVNISLLGCVLIFLDLIRVRRTSKGQSNEYKYIIVGSWLISVIYDIILEAGWLSIAGGAAGALMLWRRYLNWRDKQGIDILAVL